MAGSLELLGQDNTLHNKILANFNIANQALAGGLEQNQELLHNTQQTFRQANAAIRESIDVQAQATSAQAQAIARNNGAVGNLLSGIAQYDQNKQLQNYHLELEPRKAEDEKAARQAQLNAKVAREKQQQVSAQEFNVSTVAVDDFRNRFVVGDGFPKQGRLMFRDQALDIISGYQNLTPTQNQELTGKVIKDLDDHFDKQTTTQQKFIDDAQKQKTDSTQQAFNFQVPVKKGYVPNVAYPEDNIDNTHGYAYLHKNVAFRRAINTTANKLGIPGSWIADIIAVETSFNPREFHRTNSCGYGGLIGFGTDDAQEFGTTLRHILSLPPEKQMVYVEKYLSRPKIKRHLNKGVEYVAAAVFGGRGLLNKLIKNPSKALRTSDGAINLQTYMQRLGRDVGRRYDFTTDRQTPTTFSISPDLQSRLRVLSIDAAN